MIPLYGFKAGSNTILTLDDPLTQTDETVDMESTASTGYYSPVRFTTSPIALRGMGSARFARFTQAMWVMGIDMQVRITPMIGLFGDHEPQVFTLNALTEPDSGGGGIEYMVEADFDLVNNRFAVLVELLDRGNTYSSNIRFGAAEFTLIPKRSRVNA